MKLKEFKMKLKLSSDEKGTCKKYSKQTELIESPYRKFSKSKKKNQKMKDKDSPRYMQIIQPKCKDDKLNYETSDKPRSITYIGYKTIPLQDTTATNAKLCDENNNQYLIYKYTYGKQKECMMRCGLSNIKRSSLSKIFLTLHFA